VACLCTSPLTSRAAGGRPRKFMETELPLRHEGRPTVVPLFLTHLGCRGRCTYCDQGLIAKPFDEGDCARTVDFLATRPGKVEVGLFGGNVFGIEVQRLERIFEAFAPVREKVAAFRVSTKPVGLTDEMMALMKRHGVGTVELGIPSFNDTILRDVNRGHTLQDLLHAYEVLRKDGFAVALQVMVGLPGESNDDIREMAEQIDSLHPAYLRIYPLVILDGTPLAETFAAGRFVPVSFDEALMRATYLYLSATAAGIPVVKMGLTRNELVEEKVVGGFYHPAFGYLVRSEAFFLGLRERLREASCGGPVKVRVHRRDVPHLVGYRRRNLKRLSEEGTTVAFEVGDESPGTFRIGDGPAAVEGTVLDGLRYFVGPTGALPPRTRRRDL
jgi:histone acetyltransferase (RNA polymerase elongator complex component)